MSGERIHRNMTRTPEEKRRLQEIREHFQQERPGLDDLLASGDATEVVAQGEYLDLCTRRRIPSGGRRIHSVRAAGKRNEFRSTI
jgi:hypothetical protein